MKCSRVRDKLMDYISADLSPAEAQRIRDHLTDCAECRSELELVRRASSALNLLGGEEPAPALVGAVRDKLAREKAPARPILVPRLAMGFSAAAIIALIVTGWLRYGSVDRKQVTAVKPADSIETPADKHVAPKPTMPPQRQVAKEDQTVRIATGVEGTRQTSVKAVIRKAAQRPVKVTPTRKRVVRPEAAPEVPETRVIEPETDSERVMFIAVRPKEPEIFVTHVDSGGERAPTQLTVVREFDEGGNITSVTIEGTALEDDAEDIAPAPDRTHLLDAPLEVDRAAYSPHAGGSTGNA